jgi:RHS repeat-associated protein
VNKSGTAGNVIARPQGGGAIKGMGDTFSPDLHTGTGNLTVPIAVPPGRNKLQPELSLSYSTGHGNGPFGLGWVLSIPGVSRDTRGGVPSFVEEADTFLLSGAEPLVPVRPAPGGAMVYRPRTEGLFARISHYRSELDDYWEVRSRNGLISRYGTPALRGSDPAAVRNPEDNRQVFAWSLTETRDPFGNRIEYAYEREPNAEDGPHRGDQIYLKTIRYADYGPLESPQFLVTVDFLYEPRPDPFSQYRAGFEIRTTRRCTRIEIRTHAESTQLTRVYRLVYQDEVDPAQVPANGVSLLRQVELEGVDGETREAFPPLEFGYTRFDVSRRIYQPMTAIGDDIQGRSLAHPDFELADLFGQGLPDVVQIGDSNRYWRNLGEGRFDLPRPLDGLTPGVRLGDRGTQLADFDGDGQVDLLVSARGFNGYAPLTAAPDDASRPFVLYSAAPPFAFDDPELRLLDLDGDGITDALRTGTQFELYYHDRELGWTTMEQRTREEFDRFPDVQFSDPRVKLADMTGDGLQDIVMVSGGSVDYWPYLGRGRWGRRIAMSGRLTFPDARAYGGIGCDPRRLLLGDVDGDGLADLVYVESGRVTIWLNQSGNGWSEPVVIHGTPPVDDVDAVRLADMLGNGTEGILWTYDVRTFADSSYKFLDLTGGVKPYLLTERDNHTGARTLVEYAPSTRFYLEDERLPATRWRSRLPFPVQVVARVEVIDQISGGKLTTEYRYHQGYWDGEEREFRGFGLVEQLDTETFDQYHASGLHGDQGFNHVGAQHFSPPTLSRVWFHQGLVQDSRGNWSEADTGSMAWPEDPAMFTSEQRASLSGILRTAALTADPVRMRHAARTLRGSMLRSELYALDDSPNRDRPYTVTESLYDVREIEPGDPGAADRLRIFHPFQIASRTTQWERGTEPMTQVSFSGEPDPYGLPLAQVAIAVPRGRNPRDEIAAAGEPYLATSSVTEYAQRDDAQVYIVDRVCRTTGYELINDGRMSVLALRDSSFAGTAPRRVIAHGRSYYDGDAFVGLPLGQLGGYGAVVRSESLLFTEDFLRVTFDPADPLGVTPLPVYLVPGSSVSWTAEYSEEFRSLLATLAGYAYYGEGAIPGSPGGYYAVTERHRYDFHDVGAAVRGLPLITRDPLGADSTVEYDAYGLLPVRVTDAVGLGSVAEYDYRVLQARGITDPNGNLTEFEFSPGGMVRAQYVRGRDGEGDGANPSSRLEYDLLAFADRGQPVFVRSISRVHHDGEADVPPAERDATIESVEYTDGFGRLLQKRVQAEDTLFGDVVFGGGALPADQSVPAGPTVGRTRGVDDPVNVVVSGWQVYDNKGRVVEKYEPFFAQGWDYRPPSDAQRGQKAVMSYDPRGQLIRTASPDGSELLVVFGVPADLTDPSQSAPTAWEAYTYDANDNAGRTHGDAASRFSDHWNTPASIVLDALGRTVSTTARNGPDPSGDWYVTRSSYDVQGNLITLTDELGRVAFRYVFDLAKRRWRVDSIDAGRRDTVPDVLGNGVENRDAKGTVTLQGYDVLHRLTRLWARDDRASPVTLRQRLEYGDGGTADQPMNERDAARTNNLLGQLVRHHDEAGLTTVAAIDFKGNLLDKSRRVIADGPILAVFAEAAANNWQVPAFRVDWAPSGAQTLAAVEAQLLEPTEYRTTSSYDALNRAIQLQLPEDVEGRRRGIRPTYNSAGGLEHLYLDDTLYVERVAYDAKGQRALVAYGNGIMTRYAYDPETFRLRRMRSERYSSPGPGSYAPVGDVLQDYGYEYDLAGNILAIRDRTPGSGIPNNPDTLSVNDPLLAQLLVSGDALIRRFTYDPIYRLLTATGRECDRPPGGPPWLDVPRCTNLTRTRGYTERYQYDPMGSMLRLEHRNGTDGFVRQFTVESDSNRLRSLQLGQDIYAYVFDVNGNMTSETTSRHLEWNDADQMRVFRTQAVGSEPSVYAQYLYDSAGQRVKKLVRKQGGQVEVTHYIDGLFEHHRWGSGAQAGANNWVHLMGDKGRIALVRAGPASPGDSSVAIQYQLGDHLGSSSVVTDGAGQVTNREEFTPYGETSFGSVARKRYRHTGMERDEESSLAYHGARYYLPWTCSWVSCDPKAPSSDHNSYRHVVGNPIRLTDTQGTDPSDPDAPLSLGGVGVSIDVDDVRFGSLREIASGSCDDLNPNCSPQESSSTLDSKTWAPLKVYSAGPNKNIVWRKTNPIRDPDPLRQGINPTKPDSPLSIGEHALNEHGTTEWKSGPSPHISARVERSGAKRINGSIDLAVSIPRTVESGTIFHSTEDILEDMKRLSIGDPTISPERIEQWRAGQEAHEGGEVLFTGPVPASALETPFMRGMRGMSRAMFWIGLTFSVADIGVAFDETVKTGDIRPLARELVRQGTTWGTSLAMGAEGAAFGFAIGGPVGAAVVGLAGSIAGAIIGSGIGEWLSSLF